MQLLSTRVFFTFHVAKFEYPFCCNIFMTRNANDYTFIYKVQTPRNFLSLDHYTKRQLHASQSFFMLKFHWKIFYVYIMYVFCSFDRFASGSHVSRWPYRKSRNDLDNGWPFNRNMCIRSRRDSICNRINFSKWWIVQFIIEQIAITFLRKVDILRRPH